MLQKVLSKAHWAILIYFGFMIHENYVEHEEMMEGLNSSKDGIQGQLRRLKENKKLLDTAVSDVDKIKRDIEHMNEEIKKLQERLPPGASPRETVVMFKGIAENINMKEVDIRPEGNDDREGYSVNRYEFNSVATFLQTLIFFEKIQDTQRIFNVDSVIIEMAEQQEKRGRFQFVKTYAMLESFYQNTKPKTAPTPTGVAE